MSGLFGPYGPFGSEDTEPDEDGPDRPAPLPPVMRREPCPTCQNRGWIWVVYANSVHS